MNIRYRGKSEETGMRLAEIQFKDAEEEKVDRFLLLIGQYGYKSYAEDEVVTIKVEDQDDYAEVKRLYLNYKRFNIEKELKKFESAIQEWNNGYLTDEGLYEKVGTDLDLYLVYVQANWPESDIRDRMYSVSGGPDAYGNALELYLAAIEHQEGGRV